MLGSELPVSWRRLLTEELQQPTFARLESFVDQAYARGEVYPPRAEIFNAFKKVAYRSVRVLLLGQDPYHGPGQAHGLSFSVRSGVPLPPSLRNIFAELQGDLGGTAPGSGDLTPWAGQGVMLLNAVLTVQAHQAASHRNRGWEPLTDAVIRKLSERRQPLVFLLWGNQARNKARLIDTARHTVIESPHPSPLSARRGFFGSRPFSRTNAALARYGRVPIDWQTL